MPKRKKAAPELPVSDNAEITQTTIYPTLAAAWQDMVANLPWFEKYGSDTRRTIKYAFYMAAAEVLRTVAFRMNAEQNDKVFGDFDAEIRAYDLELQSAAEEHATMQ